LYEYCRGSPVVMVDPNGMDSEEWSLSRLKNQAARAVVWANEYRKEAWKEGAERIRGVADTAEMYSELMRGMPGHWWSHPMLPEGIKELFDAQQEGIREYGNEFVRDVRNLDDPKAAARTGAKAADVLMLFETGRSLARARAGGTKKPGVPGVPVEPEAPKTIAAKPVQPRVHKTPGVYSAADPTDDRFFARAGVEDGELTLNFRTKVVEKTSTGERTVRSSVLRGKEQLNEVLKHFEGRFETVRGVWVEGSDNLEAFNRAVRQGKDPRVAALEHTWTGERMKEAGFTEVEDVVLGDKDAAGNYTRVEPIYRRPK
jgi:hypothetical protein